MNRTTYNDIIKAFRDFCDKHYQIAQCITPTVEADFQTIENKFPSVVIVPVASNMGAGQLSLSFAVIVADILIADGSNSNDLYNDTLEIAKDFVAWFTGSPELDWSIGDEVSIEPFAEKYDDYLAGWAMQVSVTVPYDHTVCDIPTAIQ